MVKAAVVRHMSSVEDYRARLASLQGSWDTLSLLSHLRGDGADMSTTRQAFEGLANDLVHSLSEETYKKAMLALKARGQIAIDVHRAQLVRAHRRYRLPRHRRRYSRLPATAPRRRRAGQAS